MILQVFKKASGGGMKKKTSFLIIAALAIVFATATFSFAAVPAAPTLNTPTGTIGEAIPAFDCDTVANANYYYLLIQNQFQKTIFNRRYPAPTVDNGDGTCTLNPNKDLEPGDYFWLVRAQNIDGLGSASAKMAFTVDTLQVKPVAPILNTPSGTITDTTPEFNWDSEANTDYYYLIIQNQFQKTIFNKRYTTATVDNGDTTCSINPGKTLALGDYYWFVRAKNQYGFGPASAKTGFTVAPLSCEEPVEGTADVAFADLLEEMVNREGFILNTAPEYTSAMFSSYDRGSTSPNNPGWFDNWDFCQYVRQELIDGRNEWVLFDHEEPGAVVRIWLTAPLYQGTLRVYLNSSDTPVVEFPPDAIGVIPLSEESSLGRNLYLPIPYACHCKITYDGDNCFETLEPDDRFYYQINYRAYAAGTTVQSFSMDDLTTYGTEIQNVQDHLSAPSMSVSAPDRTISGTPGIVLDPGETFEQPVSGPGAITRLQISLDSAADVDQALRSTVLAIDFDGVTRVWSPVGDFFGSGPGRYPYVTWWQEVSGDNTMTSRWVMPFQETAVIRFINLGDQQVTVSLKDTEVVDDAWWEGYSMYFHATWHSQRSIPVAGNTLITTNGSDWNYVTISGKGRYMGDTLTVYNRDDDWWGEGDSKIWVDDDTFPSFFGTGTEDYYGYAFCGDGGTYEAPFHAQPRGEGDSRNVGYTTNTRTRSLDAIPFTSRLQVDMELWHWATTEMDYAVTCYWYAFDGATSNRVTELDEAAALLVE